MDFSAVYILLVALCTFIGSINNIKIGASKTFNATAIVTTAAPEVTTTNDELTKNATATALEQSTETTISPTTNTATTKPTATAKISSTTSTTTTQPTFPPKRLQPSIKVAPSKSTTVATPTIPAPDLNDTNNNTAAALNDTKITTTTAVARNFYCHCDFYKSFCDINCCCDPDCNLAALKVFNCHLPPTYTELRSRLEDLQFTHGLPTCKVNDGWLCVFRTNIRPPKELPPVNNFDTSAYYKWPQEVHNVLAAGTQSDQQNFYKYGEPLQLLNTETTEITSFNIPSSYKLPYCQITEPIRHLKSYESSCLLSANSEKLQQNIVQLMNLTSSNKILMTPKNSGNVDNMETTNPENSIEIQICRKMLNVPTLNCQYPVEASKWNLTQDMDDNVYVSHVEVKLMHNYTHILSALVLLEERLIAVDESVLWQHYRIIFVFKNQTDLSEDAMLEDPALLISPAQAKPVSGVYGYQLGEPIIIAKLIAHNESDEMHVGNQILSYLHPNSSTALEHYVLPLFTKRQGLCHKEVSKAHAINYGISEAKQCHLRVDNIATVLPQDARNFTAFCMHMQHKLLAQLLPYNYTNMEDISDVFVSQLGKPTADATKWLPLQLKNYEYAPISGDFDEEAQTFNCRNMLLSVAYEFYTANYKFRDLPKQRLVLNAVLIAGQRHDLEFAIAETVEVPLMTTVMFYDAQSLKNKAEIRQQNGQLISILLMAICLKL